MSRDELRAALVQVLAAVSKADPDDLIEARALSTTQEVLDYLKRRLPASGPLARVARMALRVSTTDGN